MKKFSVLTTAAAALLGTGVVAWPVAASAAPVPRIVGGSPSAAVSFMVQVSDVRPGVGDVFQCGGTLVAPRWVLTARHCLADAGETTAVRIGSSTLGAGARIAVDRSVTPPRAGDIALLHLVTAASGAPVTLAGAGTAFEGTGTMYGWGAERAEPEGTLPQMSPVLKRATTQVYSNENPDGDGGPGLSSWSLGETGAAYKGDSGGPLIVGGRQVGVISTVVTGPSASGFNDHAAVSAHRSWIRSVIGS